MYSSVSWKILCCFSTLKISYDCASAPDLKEDVSIDDQINKMGTHTVTLLSRSMQPESLNSFA